jgi:RimJ/RimL family protein N-acetyltransferase
VGSAHRTVPWLRTGEAGVTEWAGTSILTTPRLSLRAFRREDLPLYAAMNSDPEVVRYLGGPLTAEQSDAMAGYAQQYFARDGLGLLAVERLSDGAFLGMCGLHRLQSYPEDVEVAWRLAAAHWGHGYATEAATAWLTHGFSSLGLQRIISMTDPPNLRSLAVMHRLGMLFDHSAVVEEEGERFQAVVHAVTAEQWHSRASRPACACTG